MKLKKKKKEGFLKEGCWDIPMLQTFLKVILLFVLWEFTEMVVFRLEMAYLFSPWKGDGFYLVEKGYFPLLIHLLC